MDSFPRKGPWAGRVALLPALRRVAGMGWMLRLPPTVLGTGEGWDDGIGAEEDPMGQQQSHS